MNVRDIREALGAALAGQGFTVYTELPENPDLPCAAVGWPDEVRYNRSLNAGADVDLTVTVAVAKQDFSKAQKEIDEHMSWPGLGYLIQEHETTAWRGCRVVSASNVSTIAAGAGSALAFDFNLNIIA